MSDRRLLLVTAFLRALATGMIAVLLAAHLASLSFRIDVIGYVVAAGLTGNAAALLVATLFADRIGRKRFLLGLTATWAIGAAVVAVSSSAFAIGAGALVGMLNGMGRDRGAALAVEQAIIPATTTDEKRTGAFAWYNALQDAGHALGALLAGAPLLLERVFGTTLLAAHRVSLWAYVALAVVTLALYTRLSPGADARRDALRPISPAGRRTLAKVCGLFAIDSLAGGFLTTALVSYFFFERFGVGEAVVAVLFFGARVANAASHFGAAALARKIGLVNTMVFTHMPSSVLLVTVAFAPSFGIAAALFLLREGLVEMDVPTRQSYVMAIVAPEERTVASSVTNLVRMASWPAASLFGGVFMHRVSLMTPLVVGAAMKLAYDALLYAAFRRTKPPEEA